MDTPVSYRQRRDEVLSLACPQPTSVLKVFWPILMVISSWIVAPSAPVASNLGRRDGGRANSPPSDAGDPGSVMRNIFRSEQMHGKLEWTDNYEYVNTRSLTVLASYSTMLSVRATRWNTPKAGLTNDCPNVATWSGLIPRVVIDVFRGMGRGK